MGRRKLDPDVRNARELARRRASNRKYYEKTANLYPKHAWTREEERMVMEHSVPDSELSVKIGRSVKGIQEKRRRLKKAEAENSETKGAQE